MNSQTNNSNISDGSTETCFISETQRSITIPVLIIFAVPSICCFLFVFYHLIKLRKRLVFDSVNHHVIFLILISDFLLITTELPISLYYLGRGQLETSRICLFWIYWDYMLETTSLFLTTYASIERYILVFHRPLIKKHRYLLHYFPMLCFGLYIPILYFYLVLLSPCVPNQQYNLTAFVCGGACFFSFVSVNTYDTVVDTMLPCFILLIGNLGILLRVIMIKTKALGSTSLIAILKKNRKMILQLIGISLMSLIAWMPWVVIIIAQNFFQTSFGDWFITYILHYLPYLTTSASPFLALIGLPEIRNKFQLFKYQVQSPPTISITNTTKKTKPTLIKEDHNLIESSKF